MKKTYMQPAAEVMNLSGSKAVMDSGILAISNTEVDTTNAANQLGREEEDFGGAWDTEW